MGSKEDTQKGISTRFSNCCPNLFVPKNVRDSRLTMEQTTFFNLAYEILSWKIHRALIRAKLEPYLGFLHSVQYGKPSLVCDFMELYRYMIDDFLIDYCLKLRVKDFIVKTENLGRKKKGKREYLNNRLARDLMKKLELLFESKVAVQRIKVGKK
jgi:CRISPR/Cas system-associated endonuclease Cas1